MIFFPGASIPFSFRSRSPKTCLQFKITLLHVHPHVWRRIQVPRNYTFWDFHVAISDCMGWLDCHLHEFLVVNPLTGKEDHIGMPDPDDDFDEDEVLTGWKTRISTCFTSKNRRGIYLYDFGDGWEHEVIREGKYPMEEGVQYPRCIDGKRACPPEDAGGSDGYQEFLRILRNPKHREYQERLDWAEAQTGQKPFDPERFSPSEVHFDDPDERWQTAYQA